MHWVLLITFGFCFCSVVFGAPQDIPTGAVNENIVEEGKSTLFSVDSTEVSETLREKSTGMTSVQVYEIDKESELTVNAQEITTEKVESEGGISEESAPHQPAAEAVTGATVTKKPTAVSHPPAAAAVSGATVTKKPTAVSHSPAAEAVSGATVTKKPTAVFHPPAAEAVSGTTVTKKPAAVSHSPVVEAVSGVTVTKKPTAVTRPTKLPTKKPLRATTQRPQTEIPVTTPVIVQSTTEAPTRRYPCKCGGGMCSCCSGLILENFSVPIRSRACANVTYEPEEFAFNFKLLYNNRLLYNTRMSAKNPRPACVPINRYFGIKMCVKLTNVYMSGRNIHACLDMEGYWDDESAFQYSFNCFRIGSNGIAVVRPEDGGGLPPPPDEEEQTDEDYDDSARGLKNEIFRIKRESLRHFSSF